MTPVTYIITAPAGLGHNINGAALADALGCIDLVPEWDGVTPLQPGACAFTAAHHTPPAESHSITINTVDALRELAGALHGCDDMPPHIHHDLLRVLKGTCGGREYRRLAEYISTLRQRVIDAERRTRDADE